ncbi:hypothetical protein BV25DRAFT_1912629 [Artomyces pyxidatus]|uniref:Uncharacterized protein n=1 Tax=Artomyces pyxidatus TaxID=48021 RepID=A0ACB8TDS2_9AGAM|nr:hypothetical protein BV25DRAFT_1912629 [Artomyces pyxidatus]
MSDEDAVAFLRAMPVEEFMNDFVPAAKKRAPRQTINFDESSPDPYDVEFALQANGLLPRLCPMAASNIADSSNYPAVCVMPPPKHHEDPWEWGIVWRQVELFMQVIPLECDPFQDPNDSITDRSAHVFEAPSIQARKAREQLEYYADCQNAHAFRTFTFSVTLMSTHARLFRWDQSGVIVTERFE